MGRPSKYDTIDLEQLEKLAFLGATDVAIADFFNISKKTLNNYKQEPEFLHSLKKGKEIADAQVVKSLYKRALGYTYDEVTYEKHTGKLNLKIAIKDGTVSDVKTGDAYKLKTVVKEVVADTTACIFWLKNRQPEAWRDKHELEHSGHMKFDGDVNVNQKYKTYADRIQEEFFAKDKGTGARKL